jgi:hypothetical protein
MNKEFLFYTAIMFGAAYLFSWLLSWELHEAMVYVCSGLIAVLLSRER